MIEAYIIHILIIICIYIILGVSLNLVLGYTGLLNLGHVAFFGIGAYISALLTKASVPYMLAFVAAAIGGAVFGYLLTYATKKLKGDYLALTTLGFSFVITSILLNWTSLTRGPLGIPGIQKPSILGIAIKSNLAYLIFSAIIMVLAVYIIHKITASPFGRVLEAIRDDETKAKSLGKNTFNMKAKAMMISASIAAVAGSLFAHYITFIDPSSFALTEIILIFTIVIVGGVASIKGSIVGTCIIIIIPELLRFIALPSSILGPMRQIIYAGILLAILLYKPRGLYGRIDLA